MRDIVLDALHLAARPPRKLWVAAGCQFTSLIDPLVALDAARQGEITANPFGVFCAPGSDLVKVPDAECVQASHALRADPTDASQVVGNAATRRRESVGTATGMSGFNDSQSRWVRHVAGKVRSRRAIDRDGGIANPGLGSGGILRVAGRLGVRRLA